MQKETFAITNILDSFQISSVAPLDCSHYSSIDCKCSTNCSADPDRIALIEQLADTRILINDKIKVAKSINIFFIRYKIRMPLLCKITGANKSTKEAVWSQAALHELGHLLDKPWSETPITTVYHVTSHILNIIISFGFGLIFLSAASSIYQKSAEIAQCFFVITLVWFAFEFFRRALFKRRKVIEEMVVEMFSVALGNYLGWTTGVSAISLSYVDHWTREFVKESEKENCLKLAKQVAKKRFDRIIVHPALAR